MREYSNNEQSCEEQREEEQFKALLEKQMRREAEQIEEELENNPEIAGLSPDDSAKDKLYEKIEEYERQQAVRRLSPEDQEALRLGRQIQKEKALELKHLGTQTDQQKRLSGQGMTVLRSAKRGDLFVKFRVETPTNLTQRQKELLEEFRNISKDENCQPEAKSFFDKIKDLFAA